MIYVFKDSSGNTDEVEVSIEFAIDDLQPPKFDDDFYYASISSPKFETETELEIMPKSIQAIDGDTEINATIIYAFDEDNACIN